MINAFTEAIDALFADPNLGWDAVYTPEGGTPAAVRVFRRLPDAVLEFGDTRLSTTTAIFDVRISEVAGPQAGDTLVVQGETFVIQGTPRRDEGRLIWTIEARLT
jgi:hypothetical protein